MGFKKGDGKVIYFSFVGLIALILTITFCVLTMQNTEKFGSAFITIISVVIGYFFKADNTQNVSHETNEKK